MTSNCCQAPVWRTSQAPASGLNGLTLRRATVVSDHRSVARCTNCGKGFVVARRATTLKAERV